MYSFPLADREQIIYKGHANLYQEGEAFTGALYLTDERLVFVGYCGDVTHKYMREISLAHIRELITGKTFFLIPNVIKIVTIRDQQLKFIVGKRDTWHSLIERQMALIN